MPSSVWRIYRADRAAYPAHLVQFRWGASEVTLYVFCHCPFEEHSPDICAELYQRVNKYVPLTRLPWLSEQRA